MFTAGSSLAVYYVSGGVTKARICGLYPYSKWINCVINWSKSGDYVTGYFNSGQIMNYSSLGAWSGSPVQMQFGSVAAQLFNGLISHCLFIKGRPFSTAEINALSDYTGVQRITVIGDSLSEGSTAKNWVTYLQANDSNHNYGLCNWAVGGNSISADMATQVSNSQYDNAHIILIMLGANDNNGIENQAALQAIYEESIIQLKIYHPMARIVGLNLVKCWVDDARTEESDKFNLRNTISAACAAQGIECVSTYGLDIDRADKVHFSATGHMQFGQEIIDEVLT
jgi:lysophospholipase L1-like esterase